MLNIILKKQKIYILINFFLKKYNMPIGNYIFLMYHQHVYDIIKKMLNCYKLLLN